MTKEHEHWLELISASLDGELSDADRAALEEHLAVCPECRRVSEAFRAIGDSFPEETEPPANFTEGTMYLIRQEAARPTGIKKFFGNYGRWTGIAAAVVVLLLGFSAIRGGLLKAPTNESAKEAAGGASLNTNTTAEAPMASAASAAAEPEMETEEEAIVTEDFYPESAAEEWDAESSLGLSLQAVPAEGGAMDEGVSALTGGADPAAPYNDEAGAAEKNSDTREWPAETATAEEAVEAEEPAPEAGEPESPAEPEYFRAGSDAAASGAPEAEPELAQGVNTAISPGTLQERFSGQGWYAIGVLSALPDWAEVLSSTTEDAETLCVLSRESMDRLVEEGLFQALIYDDGAAETGLVLVEGE